MTVEIRELVIRTEVRNGKDSLDTRDQREFAAELRRQIVSECMKKIARIHREPRRRR